MASPALSTTNVSLPAPPVRLSAPAAPLSVLAARVAYQDVVERVAGCVDGGGSGQRQVLDVVAERERRGGNDQIGAFPGEFRCGIAGVVDRIRVVAQAALQGVGTGATDELIVSCGAREYVGASVAGQHVVGCIAGTVDRTGAGQREILDIGAQCERDTRHHEIDAGSGKFGHHVARVVDHVAIVAGATDHCVAPGLSVEDVRGGIARQAVVPRVTRAVECGSTRENQLLDSGREHIVDRALHDIHAPAAAFVHDIRGIVDHVGVAADVARHRVRARSAIQEIAAIQTPQRIVTRIAVEAIVARTAEERVVAGSSFVQEELVVEFGGAPDRAVGKANLDRYAEIERIEPELVGATVCGY